MQHRSTCSCSRRSFLRGSGLTLAGFGVASLFPSPFIQHAMASGGGTDRRLLFIFLRGGNDGLNCVIPIGDPPYGAGIRPTLAVPQGAAVDLNGFAYFHPAMNDLTEMFTDGELAVIDTRPGPAELDEERSGNCNGCLNVVASDHRIVTGSEMEDATDAPQASVSQE